MARILLVDDDAPLREMFAFALTSEGFDVAEAADGQIAFDSLRQQRSDLVVSDINMPVMDGYELLTKIRQEPSLALLPVILMTARPAFSGLRKGMGMGADDYLPKPFSIPELVAVVQQQLGKRASLRSESDRELQSLRESISL
ncbi:MAG TPA: response regulator, partial [Candidatus Synoicihabitans sp.]|nr:response regulator [Candidatus Synoicihabitans sp.]